MTRLARSRRLVPASQALTSSGMAARTRASWNGSPWSRSSPVPPPTRIRTREIDPSTFGTSIRAVWLDRSVICPNRRPPSCSSTTYAARLRVSPWSDACSSNVRPSTDVASGKVLRSMRSRTSRYLVIFSVSPSGSGSGSTRVESTCDMSFHPCCRVLRVGHSLGRPPAARIPRSV